MEMAERGACGHTRASALYCRLAYDLWDIGLGRCVAGRQLKALRWRGRIDLNSLGRWVAGAVEEAHIHIVLAGSIRRQRIEAWQSAEQAPLDGEAAGGWRYMDREPDQRVQLSRVRNARELGLAVGDPDTPELIAG